MKRLLDERGQTLVFSAFWIAALLGFVAFAADVGTFFHDRRNLQTAADAAAIAGAAALNYGSAAIQTAGAAASTQNGYTSGTNNVTVAINNPPTEGYHTGTGYVEAIVTQNAPSFFFSLFKWSSMPVGARAVAGLVSGGTGCIYTLGTSGTGLSLVGNATLSASFCGINVDSTSNDAMNLTGNASIDARTIGLAGNWSGTHNTSVTPTPDTDVPGTGNPLAFLSPPSVSGCVAYTGQSTLSPGCYNGISLAGQSTLNLTSGTYVINGNLSVTGGASISGQNVTFYITNNGSVNIAGTGTVDLTAPNSGPYDGLLFYVNPTDGSSIAVSGNGSSTIEGIFYAPGSPVALHGNGSANLYVDFVVNSLSLNGNTSIQDYANLNNGSVLSTPRLVE